MKKKNTFQYLLILDQSGSMDLIKDEVILAFNEQLDFLDQIKTSQKVKASLCVFNHEVTLKEISKKPSKIERLNYNNYTPSSSTALNDAIGISVNTLLDKKEKKDKVFVVVFTDGMENASRFYDQTRINLLMDSLKEDGHSVVFMCKKEEREYYQRYYSISDDCMMDFDLNVSGDLSHKVANLSEAICCEMMKE